MDKFFIQNAFKTLDEIEVEIKNKQNLKEDLEEKKPVCETYDLDELSDKYVGLGCTVLSKDDYSDERGTIQSLKDFNGDFEKSVWAVALDIGIILNLEGKDIKVDLDEKLPKDLATAYEHTGRRDSGKLSGTLDTYLPRFFGRREGERVDYENSNYVEISKEEALKNYSKAGKRNLLRVIIGGQMMMWDENNQLVTLPDSGRLPRGVKASSAHTSFKEIIENATKIYVTDERNHIITRPINNPNVQHPERAELLDASNQLNRYINWYDSDKKLRDARSSLEADNFILKDTGDHKTSPKRLARGTGTYSAWQSSLHLYKKKNEQLTKLIERVKSVTDPTMRAEADATIKKLQADCAYYLERAAQHKKSYDAKYSSARINYAAAYQPIMNFNLASLIIYKELAKQIKEQFIKTHDTGKMARYVPQHEYENLRAQVETLQRRVDNLKNLLAEAQQKLADAQSQITPELKNDYEDTVNNELESLGTEYQNVISKIAGLLGKKETNESLHEGIDEAIRIYTMGKNGNEDFIDPADCANSDDILDYAKKIFNDSDYEKVVVVKVCGDNADVLWESDEDLLDEEVKDKRSIGEIVDEKIKNESLTESKKFNIKDSDDIVDAKVYKEVGDKANDDLVVVDPSIESEDQDGEPAVGKAILQCKECKTSIFKDANNLQPEEDNEIYNIDDPCPHCGAKSGYLYIGQIASKDSAEATDDKEESNQSDKMNSDIDADDNVSLEPVDTDLVELSDIDEIQEESFDKLVNPYLTKLYENVESFKTTNITQTGRNKLMVEGIITGKNKKELNTQFLFTIKENKNKSIVFEGYNKLLTEQKDSFNLKSKYENKSLLFESLSYKYNKDDQLIEGLEENK